MFHKTGGNMTGASSVKGDVYTSGRKEDITLADYIERKEQAYKKKLTFEEWWGTMKWSNPPTYYEWAHEIWKAAQENM